ncbi:processed acidic surface protein [Oceanobacillus piezotolerans]|uniref:Processed acidic surface protein n=1 Tax=Oceanobacillus piezotolerans TaxID=2448030 RepID=A0A498DGX3_9BACI|nr:processed acidic surface protein [Oceanobacillus piezotolerans]RLL43902.1 processed acidic surface protein [Oceanobacillus piezotolerans]
MKHLFSVLLTIVIGIGVLPVMTYAIELNEPEFEKFLKDIGWDKQDYVDYLESKEWDLEYFESVDELGTPLSEESVQLVLEEFGLSREELNELLVEYGDLEEGQDVLEGTWIIFSEELHEYVDFYLNGWEGTPIDEDNLQQLLDDYGFESKEALEQFLNENDDSIENYEYIEDLYLAVDFHLDDLDLDEIYGLFTEIGLTNEELEKLFAHLETLDYEDPAFLDKLIELSERMMAFEDFETAGELSAEQIAELFDIFYDMLNLFEVETKYYLVKDGEKQTVSFETLMTMDTTKGYDLLIEIYNKQGEFLADILLTADMFGSDLIQETGKDIKQAEEILTENQKASPALKAAEGAKEAKTAKPPVKTVKGGELPATASDYAGNALVGLAFVLAGVFLFRRLRIKGN